LFEYDVCFSTKNIDNVTDSSSLGQDSADLGDLSSLSADTFISCSEVTGVTEIDA